MMKIGILGIGGVGGYVGGRLAEKYAGSADIRIIFLARNENKKRIRESGLKLVSASGEKVVRPCLVSDDPDESGMIDLLVCTVKTYDLTEAIRHYKSCIGSHTIILPLENGVDAAEKIRKVLPDARIWKGCVYVNARLVEPGVVNQIGTNLSVFFGSSQATDEELRSVETIFRNAGIETKVPGNILQTTWEKFVFISSIATITSYLDVTIGELISSEKNKMLLEALLEEAKSVAHAKGIVLADNLTENLLKRAHSLPYEATSSMHTDFRNNKKTEIDSLTGYIIREAKSYHLPVPTYEMMYEVLVKKASLI
ncbi:MAG: ketopantoate reductase family protein [Flavisolibacter sp.]|jgi:2-dehydropantoate 2-reductase